MSGPNEEDSADEPHDPHVRHQNQYEESELDSAPIQSDKHSVDITVSYPVDDPADLEHSWYVQTLLREVNLKEKDSISKRTDEEEKTIQQDYDQIALKYAPRALRVAGLDLNTVNLPVNDGYILALLLRQVRGDTDKSFASHIDEYRKTLHELDLPGGKSSAALSGRRQKLREEDEEYIHQIEEASNRVVFAIYRAGYRIPQEVLEQHEKLAENLSPIAPKGKEEFEEGYVPQDHLNESLKNWAEPFLEQCILEPLQFDRDASTQYPLVSFYGLLAHAALQSASVSEGSKSCSWLFDDELIPSEGAISTQIKKLSIEEISDMFFDANKRFLEFASEYSIFDSPDRFAYDPTRIPWYGEEMDDAWMKSYGAEDQQWEFGLLGITEPNIRFGLGIYPIGNKVKYGPALRRLLSRTILDTPVKPQGIIMDRGLSGWEVIDHCRSTIGKNWVILGKKNEDGLAKFIGNEPIDESQFYTNIDHFNELNEKPNALVIPVDEEEAGDNDQRLFITDYEEGEIDPETINYVYRNRRRIETTIRQLKHDFKIPVGDHTSSKIKYFYINLSMLFLNLHNLVNNSLSPEHAVPPRTPDNYLSAKEVLSGIRHVAFEKADDQT